MKEWKAAIIRKLVIFVGMGCVTFLITFALAKDIPFEAKLEVATGLSLTVATGSAAKG
ncbi:MAG: hypothetical protein WA919_08860 [Coleofasciculaceae cyanobacterium]